MFQPLCQVTYDNDYALLFLNAAIKYSLSPSHPVGPICMPKPQYDMELLNAIKDRGNCRLLNLVCVLHTPSSTLRESSTKNQ